MGLSKRQAWQRSYEQTVQVRAFFQHIWQTFFSCRRPPDYLIEMFERRRDNQIIDLARLSTSLGLSTFAELIWGRDVVTHSDSKGSELRLVCGGLGHLGAFAVCEAAIRRWAASSGYKWPRWNREYMFSVQARMAASRICLLATQVFDAISKLAVNS